MSNNFSHRQVSYDFNEDKFEFIKNADQFLSVIINILDNKKAQNILVFGETSLAKYTLLAEHDSTTALKAIAAYIGFVSKQFSNYEVRFDGMHDSQWVVVDVQDIIIHLFLTEARSTYSLETLFLEKGVKLHVSQIVKE